MKKSVFACLLALATIFPGSVSMVYAQAAQSGQITIKDPAEYNAYTNAIGQSTPAAKAAAIEAFLTQYPNSIVKAEMLEQLMLAYQGDPVKMLDAADRLLAVDPGNLRALATAVYLEESQAATKTSPADAQPIYDKAAAQAQTGLSAAKPAAMADADYQKLKTATAPIFDSAIGKDDDNKKDYAGAIAAFTNELKAYPTPEATQSGPGLNDTYLLGQAYAQQTPPDLKNAAWFFTRAAQFAPPQAKRRSRLPPSTSSRSTMAAWTAIPLSRPWPKPICSRPRNITPRRRLHLHHPPTLPRRRLPPLQT